MKQQNRRYVAKNGYSKPHKQSLSAAKPSAQSKRDGLTRILSAVGGWLQRYGAYVWTFVSAVVLGSALCIVEGETLFQVQELNLFLPGGTFADTLWVFPGGVLQWMACFMTDFFFYPWLGTLFLVLTWILSGCFLVRACRLNVFWSWLPMLLVAALVGSIVQMGYFMYYIKLQGYYFAASLGILFAMAGLCAAVGLFARKFWAGVLWLVVWTVAGYPLFGAYGLFGTFCMAVAVWRVPGLTRGNRLWTCVVAALLVVAVPLVSWQFYNQTNLRMLWVAALPSFDLQGEVYGEYRAPFYVLFAVPVVCALVRGIEVVGMKLRRVVCLAGVAASVFAVWGLCKVWYTDLNFHIEHKMARAIEECDWDCVPILFNLSDGEPTRLMVMNKNLALFRAGRAGDEMFRYREGGAKPVAPFTVRLTHVGGKQLYFHYGQENYCYRWCMEDAVSYGLKAEYLKFMTKSSIVNGDFKVARKYINMLKKTLFHKDWAVRYERFLDDPSLIDGDGELGIARRMMPKESKLSSDMNVIEMYLMKTFGYEDSDDPLRQEQNLISAMQLKDIKVFWARFYHYALMHEKDRMPKHFQEAAILYGNLEHDVDISHMPFDAEVRREYEDFMDLTSRYGNLPEEQLAEIFRPRFGGTFYFFYFLTNGIKTY